MAKIYNLNNYEITIFESKDGDGFVATTLEMPSISGCSATPEEALRELQIAFSLAQKSFEEDNEDMPEPLRKNAYSGQFRVRTSKDLHYELVKAALIEQTSLNQLVNYILAKGVAALHQKRC